MRASEFRSLIQVMFIASLAVGAMLILQSENVDISKVDGITILATDELELGGEVGTLVVHG